MKTNQDRFEPGYFFHVFNRTNNKEKLFTKPENYRFFLSKYKKYLLGYVDTYAYCLLINHFHILLRVKDESVLRDVISSRNDISETGISEVTIIDYQEIIRQQFRKLFISYAKAFNKQENRYGNLFQRPFKRKAIQNEAHFSNGVFYIHANPEKHKLTTNFKSYLWSSYISTLSDQPTLLKRKEVLDWYGGRDRFIEFHDQPIPLGDPDFTIE